jgi:hypothetical protein
MCAADPTGLPYSFGTDSLQSHLITHTDTPGNYNRLLHVYIKLSGKKLLRLYMCAADPTGLSFSYGTDSWQTHLITYTGRSHCVNIRKMRYKFVNLLLSHMCAADPTGISYSFGTDGLQPHLITYTESEQYL